MAAKRRLSIGWASSLRAAVDDSFYFALSQLLAKCLAGQATSILLTYKRFTRAMPGERWHRGLCSFSIGMKCGATIKGSREQWRQYHTNALASTTLIYLEAKAWHLPGGFMAAPIFWL